MFEHASQLVIGISSRNSFETFRKNLPIFPEYDPVKMAMSDTPKKTLRMIAIGLGVLTILFATLTGYYAFQLSDANNKNNGISGVATNRADQITALNGQVDNYTAWVHSLKTELASTTTLRTQLAQEVAHLQAELAANATLNAQLNLQIAGLNSQIADLSNKITMLQARVDKLSKAEVIAVFTDVISNPVCQPPPFGWSPGRGAVATVTFANLGTTPAKNAQITVSFLAADGTALCTTPPIALSTSPMSDVLGRSIDLVNPTILQGSCFWFKTVMGPGDATQTSSSITWS